MLSKLYKNEFKSLLRILIPVWGAVVVLAGFARLSIFVGELIPQTGNGYSSTYIIINSSLMFFYVISIFAMFILCLAATVQRFYKNLFTSEGYLTLSLPFTSTQHIVCKLLCAAIMTIASIAVAFLSFVIVSVGTETFNSFIDAIKQLFAIVRTSDLINIILFVVEYVLIFIAMIFSSLLQFYTSIALGQTFKNKVGGAVLSYVIIYAIFQLLGTILVVFASIFGLEFSNIALKIGAVAFTHIILWLMFIAEIGFSIAFFFITKHMMDKKLNLE